MPAAVAAVASVFVAAETAAAVGAVVGTVLQTAAIGAAIGAAGAAITGGDIGKGALLGGLTGAVAGGISVAMNGVSASAAAAANEAVGLSAGVEGSAVAGQTGALFGGSGATTAASGASTAGATTATKAATVASDFSGAYTPGQFGGSGFHALEASTPSQGLLQSASSGGVGGGSPGFFDFLNKEHPTLMDYGKMQAMGEGVKSVASAVLAPDPREAVEAQTEGALQLQAAKSADNQISLGGVQGPIGSVTAEYDTPLWRQLAENPEWRQPLLKPRTA